MKSPLHTLTLVGGSTEKDSELRQTATVDVESTDLGRRDVRRLPLGRPGVVLHAFLWCLAFLVAAPGLSANQVFLKGMTPTANGDLAFSSSAVGPDGAVYALFNADQSIGFDGRFTVGPGPILAKLGTDGNWVWAKGFGGALAGSVRMFSVAVNAQNIVIAGLYTDGSNRALSWDGTPIALTTESTNTMGLVLKLDAKGDAQDAFATWNFGPAGVPSKCSSGFTAVAIHADGGIFLGGYYEPFRDAGGDHGMAWYRFDGLAVPAGVASERLTPDSAHSTGGGYRRVPFVLKLDGGGMDWEWTRNYLAAPFGGYSSSVDARLPANIANHGQVNKIVLDPSGNAYFAGRVVGGQANNSFLWSTKLTPDGVVDRQSIQTLMGNSTGDYRVANSFMLGRVKLDGQLTGFNFSFDAEAADHEAFLSDLILTPNGGYTTGAVRGNAVSFNQHVLGDRPYLKNGTSNGAADETRQQPFVFRFDTSSPDLTVNRVGIFLNNKTWLDPVQAKGASLAAGPDGTVYLGLSMRGGVNSYTVGNPSPSGPDLAQAVDSILSPGSDSSYMHAVVRLTADLSYGGEVWKPETDLALPFLWFPLRDTLGDYAIDQGTFLPGFPSGAFEFQLLRAGTRLLWAGTFAAYNTSSQGVVASGNARTLAFANGEAATRAQVSVPASTVMAAYLTALDLGRATPSRIPFIEKTSLRIVSGLPAFTDAAGTITNLISPRPDTVLEFVRGTEVKVKVPYQIYSDVIRTAAGTPDATKLHPRLDEVLFESTSQPATFESYRAKWPNYPRTRHTFTGFRIDEQVFAGQVPVFTVTLEQDTTLTVNYRQEHALDMVNLVSGETATQTILADEQQRLLGNPTYSTSSGVDENLEVGVALPTSARSQFVWGRTWIPASERVQIDVGVGSPLALPPGERFVATEFKVRGSAETAQGLAQVQTFSPPAFTMTEPQEYEITWKKQIQLSLGPLAEPEARDSVFVAHGQLADGAAWLKPYTGGDATFSPTRWFDYGSSLLVAAVDAPVSADQTTATGLQLNGWLSAGGHFSTSQGRLENLTASPGLSVLRAADSATPPMPGAKLSAPYWNTPPSHFYPIPRLTTPTFVTWDYGGVLFQQFVAIGQFVGTNTVHGASTDSKGKSYALRPGNIAGAPTVSIVEGAPPGTSPDNALAWDAVKQRLYPLRPGRYLARFPAIGAGGQASQPVLVEITAGFPGDALKRRVTTAPDNASPFVFPLLGTEWPGSYKWAHYRHIAGAPGVDLDPDSTDGFFLQSLPYFEAASGATPEATVVNPSKGTVVNGRYASGLPGKGVLLFSRSHFVENPDGTIQPRNLENPGSFPATGDLNFEPLMVRIVETRAGRTNSEAWSGNSGFPLLGSLGGTSYSAAVSGTTAIVVGPTAPQFRSIDLSDPANPRVLAALSDGGNGFNDLNGSFHVVRAGSIAYVAANGDNALNLIDVSDPRAPRLLSVLKDGVGGFNDLGGIFSVAISGNLAYAAARTDNAVSIIDVSNPALPTLVRVIKAGVGGFDKLGGPLDIVVQNSLAYIVANADSALVIVDVGDPANPKLVRVIKDGDPGFGTLGGLQGVRVSDGIAYVNGAEGATFIDLRDPSVPLNLGAIAATREWLEVVGTTLLARNGSASELSLYDLRNLAAPRLLGALPFTGNQRPLFLNSRIYLPNAGDFSIYQMIPGNPDPTLIVEAPSATIGEPLQSVFDTAGLGTGWVLNNSPKLLVNPRIYTREQVRGPIIPVNRRLPGDATPWVDELTVVWYEDLGRLTAGKEPGIAWPYQPVLYRSRNFQLPLGLERLYTSVTNSSARFLPGGANVLHTSSRLGSDGLGKRPGGNWSRQFDLFGPAHRDITLYHQPDKAAQGYNPNEEHALIAPSLFQHGTNASGGLLTNTVVARGGGDQAFAVFALRDDLNYGLRRIARETSVGGIDPASFVATPAQRENYTSEPFVLAQYYDTTVDAPRMAVYLVAQESDLYKFRYPVTATQPIKAPYPVDTVTSFGANDTDPLDNLDNPATPAPGDGVINGTYFVNGTPTAIGAEQAVWWMDPAGVAWAISGPIQRKDSAGNLLPASFTSPHLYAGFFYNLREDFWYPTPNKIPGDPVPWLPGLANSNGAVLPATITGPEGVPTPVRFDAVWPENLPILKVGESLTYAGGEFKADHPTRIVGGEVSETPGLPGVIGWAAGQVLFDSANPALRSDHAANFTARLLNPLVELSARLVQTEVTGQDNTFQPASADRITVRGGLWKFLKLSASLQKRVSYDPTLQKLMLQGYVSERTLGDPSLSAPPDPVYVLEPNILTVREARELAALFAGAKWATAVNQLYNQSRDPNRLVADSAALPADEADADLKVPYLAGLENYRSPNPATGFPGTLYFDANRRAPAAAFGPGLAVVPNDDLLKASAAQFNEGYLTLVENAHPDKPELSPVSLFVVKLQRDQRYRGAIKPVASQNVFDEKIVLKHSGDFGGNVGDLEYEWWFTPTAPGDLGTPSAPSPLARWQRLPGQSQNTVLLQGDPALLLGDLSFFCRYKHRTEPAFGSTLDTPFPWQWAGAGNSPQLQADGSPQYLPQLVMGWVKRVLDQVNPFEARFHDFANNDAPATYSSLIKQAGPPPRGPVALNADKNVVENVGLIELYQTVLDRAVGLSIGLDQPTANFTVWQALLLAGTRLNQLYTLLANEAYADAQDPTIGLGADRLAPAAFAFENQEASLLHEELALLRGTDFGKGWPVENRLFWNFTKGAGESAYASNYGIKDVNADGFIDESDASILFPQGHGDAWGHYLSATKAHYALLRHPQFSWPTFAELYSLLGVVVETDFLDEVTFSRAASAKARAGLEIVRNTYRLRYEQDANGQWQGYGDTDPARAWGVAEWATRAYQGTYFDWVVANSLMPYVEQLRYSRRGADGTTLTYPFDFPVAQIADLRVMVNGQSVSNFTAALGAAGGTITFGVAPISGARVQIDNANALDVSANQLDRIDRVSVAELPELVSVIQQIQMTLDEADNGLNPLGLANDAVPFDLNIPQARTTVGVTQFDQIYGRAINAAQNALATFRFANLLESRLRTTAEATDAARDKAADQDRSYRSSLIEIFGTPYDGLIGPGGLYPPGYQGPDLLLYQYVDYNSVDEQLLPQESQFFRELFEREIFGSYDEILTSAQRTILAPYTLRGGNLEGFALKDLIQGFTHLDVLEADQQLTSFYARFVNGTNFTLRTSRTDASTGFLPTVGGQAAPGELLSFRVPVSPTTAFGFKAQPNWGKRRAVGQIQTKIQDLVGAQIDLRKALQDYEVYLRVLEAKIANQEAAFAITGVKNQQDAAIKASEQVIKAAKLVKERYQKFVSSQSKSADTVLDGLVTAIPDVVGLANDINAPLHSALIMASLAGKKTFDALDFAADTIFASAEYSFGLEKDLFEQVQKGRDFQADQRKFVYDLVKDLSDEATQRYGIASKLNSLVKGQYELDTLVAKGFRTVSEREVLNKRLAADAQSRRYSDLLLRVNRNTAMQRYEGALDLAIKYAWLAGKAYEYEANLDPAHPASPARLLNELIKTRTLGSWDGVRPAIGQGGLAEVLAKLRANFDLLAPSLGINNPQGEVGRLSLRTEWARIPTNAARNFEWSKVLQARRVDDLRRVPEFTRFCRPFAPPSAGPQPGLVIPIGTEITAGKNFFGFPYGARDHAFDPTQYATKIRGVSLWFVGNEANVLNSLGLTPRAYLVPAGLDVMRMPDSPSLQTRSWNVVDQRIPIPFPVSDQDLRNPNWLVSADSLDGAFAESQRFSAFRAFYDNLSGPDYSTVNELEITRDTRLVGRSVWNTKWVLIIPGALLHADPNVGLDRFVGTAEAPGVTDIKILFETYAQSGR